MTAEEPEIRDQYVSENACDEAMTCVSPNYQCATGAPCPPVGWLPPDEVNTCITVPCPEFEEIPVQDNDIMAKVAATADDLRARYRMDPHAHLSTAEPERLRHPLCAITKEHPKHRMLRHPGAECDGAAAVGSIPWA